MDDRARQSERSWFLIAELGHKYGSFVSVVDQSMCIQLCDEKYNFFYLNIAQWVTNKIDPWKCLGRVQLVRAFVLYGFERTFNGSSKISSTLFAFGFVVGFDLELVAEDFADAVLKMSSMRGVFGGERDAREEERTNLYRRSPTFSWSTSLS